MSNHLIDHKFDSVSLPIEDKGHVELSVASHPHPLVHENKHILPCHREDGLGEGRCVPNHVAPGTGVCLDQSGIVGQRQKLVEYLMEQQCKKTFNITQKL